MSLDLGNSDVREKIRKTNGDFVEIEVEVDFDVAVEKERRSSHDRDGIDDWTCLKVCEMANC